MVFYIPDNYCRRWKMFSSSYPRSKNWKAGKSKNLKEHQQYVVMFLFVFRNFPRGEAVGLPVNNSAPLS